MDVSNSSLCLLVVCADLLNQECIQERWRDDHQIPNPFQSHTSSRHHRRVGGDYYWSCGIGRSVVAVHYVRDRSLFCSNRVNQNKYSLIAGLSRFSSHHPILLWFLLSICTCFEGPPLPPTPPFLPIEMSGAPWRRVYHQAGDVAEGANSVLRDVLEDRMSHSSVPSYPPTSPFPVHRQ